MDEMSKLDKMSSEKIIFFCDINLSYTTTFYLKKKQKNFSFYLKALILISNRASFKNATNTYRLLYFYFIRKCFFLPGSCEAAFFHTVVKIGFVTRKSVGCKVQSENFE